MVFWCSVFGMSIELPWKYALRSGELVWHRKKRVKRINDEWEVRTEATGRVAPRLRLAARLAITLTDSIPLFWNKRDINLRFRGAKLCTLIESGNPRQKGKYFSRDRKI